MTRFTQDLTCWFCGATYCLTDLFRVTDARDAGDDEETRMRSAQMHACVHVSHRVIRHNLTLANKEDVIIILTIN